MKSKRGLIIISILIALFATAGVLIVMLLDGENKDTIPGTYADLYDALQNAETGDTVYMTKTLSCDREVFVKKSITIDLGGKVLKATEDFEVSEGATLTFTNGTVQPAKEFVVKGNLVVGAGAKIAFVENYLFGVAGSKVKIDGGRISSVYQTIETQGDFEMTSGSVQRITVYGNLLISGGKVDSCSNFGNGFITGGSFGSTDISDPLRNYGPNLRIEGTESAPVSISSSQWGLYTHSNTNTVLKNVIFHSKESGEFHRSTDIYAGGDLTAYGLTLKGFSAHYGNVVLIDCNISGIKNSFGNHAYGAVFSSAESLTLKNCTVTSEGIGIANTLSSTVVLENTTVDAKEVGIGGYCKLDMKSGYVTGISSEGSLAKYKISGGTVTKPQNGSIAIDVGDYSEIEITGGTVEGDVALSLDTSVKAKLSGGTFKGGIQIVDPEYWVAESSTCLGDLLDVGCSYQPSINNGDRSTTENVTVVKG